MKTTQAKACATGNILHDFGAADRLHRSAEFLRLQRRGIRLQAKHFVLYAGKIDYAGDHAGKHESAEGPRKRLGITVSRRVGNAVVRNRVKRQVRECFRCILRERLDDGMSIVVIALVGAGNLEPTAINAGLVTATLNLAGKRPRQ